MERFEPMLSSAEQDEEGPVPSFKLGAFNQTLPPIPLYQNYWDCRSRTYFDEVTEFTAQRATITHNPM